MHSRPRSCNHDALRIGFPQNHVEVGEALGLVDFDRGAEVSGSKFYYMKGMGALLELALINYAMAKCLAKGFVPYTTPDLGACGRHAGGVTSAAGWRDVT